MGDPFGLSAITTVVYKFVKTKSLESMFVALQATSSSSWSLGPSPRRPTTGVCPRRAAANAFVHIVVFIIQRIDRYLYYCCTGMYLVLLLLCIPGSAQ